MENRKSWEKKALNHHKQKSDKKGCVAKIYREIIITHTTLANSEDGAFCKHGWVLVPRLKVNYQKAKDW